MEIDDIGKWLKKNEYEDAHTRLLKYKSELEGMLDEIKANVDGFKEVYEEDDNFKGQVCSNYLTKSEEKYEEMLSIVTKLEDKIATISERADKAYEIAESYKEKLS